MAPVYKSNHVQEGIDLLLEQFKKPNSKNEYLVTKLQMLLTTFLIRIQEFEDMYFNMLEGLDSRTASGDLLDKIGSVVGVGRGSYTDAQYRDMIKSFAISNSASGTFDDFNRMMAVFGVSYLIQETGDGCVNILINASITNYATDIILQIKRLSAISVTVNLLTNEFGAGLPFKLKDLYGSDPIDGGMLYDLNSPNAVTAGKFLYLT